MRQRHSSEFKESIVQKITMPGGPTITNLGSFLVAEETRPARFRSSTASFLILAETS